jgi:hypothetical protein
MGKVRCFEIPTHDLWNQMDPAFIPEGVPFGPVN